MCGEQSPAFEAHQMIPGSSPRVRGAAGVGDALVSVLGIIPACAGSSQNGKSWLVRGRDHPRVCGEQSALSESVMAKVGSSPRVRGAGRVEGEVRHGEGIIPACAGSRP